MHSLRTRRSIDELIRRGHEALEAQHFDEAEALARRILMREAGSIPGRQLLSQALIEQSRYLEALDVLAELLQLDPEDPVTHSDAGVCLFYLCDFEKAELALRRALELEPDDVEATYFYGLCVERRHQYQLADELFERAFEADRESFVLPTRISRQEFQRLVDAAIKELPADIRDEVKNVTLIVDDLPTDQDLTEYDPPLDPCLFGLYVGVPLTERSTASLPMLPDTIYIYQRNLERVCEDRETLQREIRITLLHEVGHYLGFDEDDMAERGLA
jgi:predicted Zn-dependent protease with MMP-like domain